MHLPSFFFHVSIDLIKPSLHLAEIVEANKNLLEHRKVYKEQLSRDRSAQQTGSTARKDSLYQHSILAEGYLHKAEFSTDGKVSEHTNATGATGSHDWRCSKIQLRSINMSRDESLPRDTSLSKSSHSKDISANSGGTATKGRFEPIGSEEGELGWGVVRLYRDTDETPGLYDDASPSKVPRHGKAESSNAEGRMDGFQSFRDEDCTMLCILAVPSYLTPSDFLGFVGEKTREGVSHFRMIRTDRSNRYMVLMKFRSGKRARDWRKEWNGKAFNDVEVRQPRETEPPSKTK